MQPLDGRSDNNDYTVRKMEEIIIGGKLISPSVEYLCIHPACIVICIHHHYNDAVHVR